jgi:hypothetical protein
MKRIALLLFATVISLVMKGDTTAFRGWSMHINPAASFTLMGTNAGRTENAMRIHQYYTGLEQTRGRTGIQGAVLLGYRFSRWGIKAGLAVLRYGYTMRENSGLVLNPQSSVHHFAGMSAQVSYALIENSQWLLEADLGIQLNPLQIHDERGAQFSFHPALLESVTLSRHIGRFSLGLQLQGSQLPGGIEYTDSPSRNLQFSSVAASIALSYHFKKDRSLSESKKSNHW